MKVPPGETAITYGVTSYNNNIIHQAVSVVVSTYGDDKWKSLAQRAVASAEAQTIPVQVVQVHGNTLASARNLGAARASGEWQIFLDADDELDPRYVEHMLAAEGDIRRPSTLGIVDGKEDDYPVLIPYQDIRVANYIVIGAMHRRSDFLAVGGFRELPILEDWALWLALVTNGANVVDVPEAIYRVHVNPRGRNQNAKKHGRIYTQLRNEYRGRI